MPASISELRDAYLENADYDVNGDVTKAKLFVSTVRQILLLQPSEGQTGGAGGELFRFDMKVLAEQLRLAQDFVAARAGGAVKYVDLTCFRE